MNYEKLYFAFIEKFKSQKIDEGVYTEIHHIIPRHAGGDDSKENLVELTYDQHVFVHKLYWKAYNTPQSLAAYRLMSGISTDRKREISSMAGKIGGAVNRDSGHISELGKKYGKICGKRSVDSGLLDLIREKANTSTRQQKLRELQEDMLKDGRLLKARLAANEAWKGSHHTEEWKKNKSAEMSEYRKTDVGREQMLKAVEMSAKKKAENSKQLSDSIILNAERNEEFLHMTSSRSKSIFISPEGLEFESPIFAAGYYGNVEYYVIENWCKRNQNGWTRKPKAGKD